jgi:hypothetical protein
MSSWNLGKFVGVSSLILGFYELQSNRSRGCEVQDLYSVEFVTVTCTRSSMIGDQHYIPWFLGM